MSYRERRLFAETEDERGEWQCTYCGRFMDHKLDVDLVFESGWWVPCCMVCVRLLKGTRLVSLKGKQRLVLGLLRPDPEGIPPDHAVFVSARCVLRVKPRVYARKARAQEV